MNKFLLILYVLIGSLTFGQNLVYNGDFEIYDTCPKSTSIPGDLQIEHCTGWTAPRFLGTSDYFNECNNATPSNFAGVPYNILGYQPAYNGVGYCGFFAWDIDFEFDYREYIQNKLSNPLEAGKEYKLSFYVSNQGSAYSLIRIGALFSHNNYNSDSYAPIVSTPQVVNQNDYLIDSLGWTKIEGSFVAKGGEEYLTFGYFEDSVSVFDTLNTHTDEFISKSAYYFIDGIELIEVISIPNVITPNDDNSNEFFELNFNYKKVSIFNRWGDLIWVGSDGQYWNGRTQNGVNVSEGTYFYIIETDTKKHQGFVQVIR